MEKKNFRFLKNRFVNNYSLKRDFKINNDVRAKVVVKVERKVDAFDKVEIVKKQFGDIILEFTNVIKKNISSDNLDIFYNNISSLKTISTNLDDFHKSNGDIIEGAYSLKNNTIKLNEKMNSFNLVTYHELLHASSTIYDSKNDMIFSGFYQRNKEGKKIGEGLTEGYTQYLAEKYFNRSSNAYSFEKLIVKKIESLIGKDKMESFYFKADLRGLIDYLSMFRSEKEVYDFIVTMDFISKHYTNSYLTNKSYEMIEESMRNTYSYLIKSFFVKNLMDISSRGIEEVKTEEVIEKTLSDVSDFPLVFYLDKKQIDIYDFKLADASISEVLDELSSNSDIEIKNNSK